MHPLTKIKFVRSTTLNTGVQCQHITTELPRLRLQPVEGHFPETTRTCRLVGHQVIDIKPTTFVSVLDYAPQRDGTDRIALGHYDHPTAVGKHLAQSPAVIHWQ